MSIHQLEIDESRYEVRVDRKEVSLAAKEWDILLLLKSTNVVMTRREIFDTVWPKGSTLDYDSRTVDQHICRLRRKMWNSIIKTVPNRGYKFAA